MKEAFVEEPKVDSGRDREGYMGTETCRECHAPFYEKWANSFHGLAMRPYNAAFAGQYLSEQSEPLNIGGLHYAACIADGEGYIEESGPEGRKKYPISQVMGGKNVFFFLTPLEKGRLQALPLGYDVRDKRWYDMPAKAVRHALGADNQIYPWRDPAFTFNTSCYGCHVSQLSSCYDAPADTYTTSWREPGINCETCHGPGGEHVRQCREAVASGKSVDDLKIRVLTKRRGVTAEQINDTCAVCHAKMDPITPAYVPGENFFQHFDLTTLEDVDFYPDGRDLGENYTYTLWRMNPCVRKGGMDCLHCHTSSGRYRFSESGKENEACAPCHQSLVNGSAEHSHHTLGSQGDLCIRCHMPTTSFGNMRRTDHSGRPPYPEMNRRYKSPDACTLCHAEKGDAWVTEAACKWYGNSYQSAALSDAALIQAAREHRWETLEEMTRYLVQPDRDEMIAASLMRLLRACTDARKWPPLLEILQKDPSPLLRARAAEALGDGLGRESVPLLIGAMSDAFRLVRIRAVASLAPLPTEYFTEAERNLFEKVSQEFVAAMTARPDNYNCNYNLGVFYADCGQHAKAVQAYETSIRFRPDAVASLVNASISYSALQKNDQAEASLRRALDLAPENISANLNLGLLLGEKGDLDAAAAAFEKTLSLEANMPIAAYNLGVIRGRQGRVDEALNYCKTAWEGMPYNAEYARTYEYYLQCAGKKEEAAKILGDLPRYSGH